MSLPPMFTALRRGPFARYLSGEAVSMVGTWMQMAAQAWVVTSLTPSALHLGALNFTSGLPMLVLALLGGNLADRLDKRLILHATLLLQALTALSIGWLIGSGHIALWHLFTAAGVLGIAAAFEVPTVSAFVPELVPREEMSSAIALDRSIFHATRLFGPALGGYLLSRHGASTVYYLNAATFLALIAALLTIPRHPQEKQSAEARAAGGLLAGLRYVRQDEPTLAMVLLLAAITLFVSPVLVITMPVYARQVLGLGADRMGLLMAISGLGSFAGSLGLLSIPLGHRALALKLGSGLAILALLGMSQAQTFAQAAAAVIALTLGLSICFGLANIVIQERAPDPLRGRISAVAGMAFFGILPFSGLLLTTSIDFLTFRRTIVGCAAGFGLTAAWLLFGRRRLSPSS